MRSWYALIALMLCSLLPGAAVAASDPYKDFFNESFGSFSEELKTARQEGKKGVMVFFEMDECPFCHFMKESVLNQPKVQAFYREHFLLFPVDINGDVQMTDFQGKSVSQKDFAFKQNRVRATPVIAFYDLDGKEIHRHTGRTTGVDEFLLMGEYVAEGAYKQMPFVKYKREKKK